MSKHPFYLEDSHFMTLLSDMITQKISRKYSLLNLEKVLNRSSTQIIIQNVSYLWDIKIIQSQTGLIEIYDDM